MSLKRFVLFSALAVFALHTTILYPTRPALAQDAEEMEEEDVGLNLVPRGAFALMVQRVPGVEGDFNIHASNIGVVSGCIKVEEAVVKVSFAQNKVDITLEEDPKFELNNEEVRYSPYSCDIKTGTLTFDVKLNRDELIERGVKVISLKSKKFGMYADTKIEVSKEKIVFRTQYQGGSGYLTYWFYPSDTVVVHAPSAKAGQDVGPLLDAFAKKNGLVPIKDTFADFETPYWLKNVRYYTDPTGKILGKIGVSEKDIEVGVIQPTQTMYGPSGPEEKPYDMAVFARLPRLYD